MTSAGDGSGKVFVVPPRLASLRQQARKFRTLSNYVISKANEGGTVTAAMQAVRHRDEAEAGDLWRGKSEDIG